MRTGWPAACLIGAALLSPAADDATGPPGGADWKLDVVHRRDGRPLRGLVVEDTPDHVLVKCVLRKPGAPTVVITERLARTEVESLELLGDADRTRLRNRLRQLARERQQLAGCRGDLEHPGGGTADAIELRPTAWPVDGKSPALAYQSTLFRVVSTARPEVVRYAALELEQVFTAYARAFPPRTAAPAVTTVLLLPSVADYTSLVRARGLNLLNPAFYDATRNQVVCASDLQRLADENEGVRREHDRQRAAIKQSEAELRKAYHDRVPAEQFRPLEEAWRRMQALDDRNAAALEQSRRRLFQRLYHEAFHAYVAAAVYPPAEGELPRWLNEGLAQTFETAFVEAGELRVGTVDAERYDALRAALRGRDLPPLADLLKSGPKQFLVAHAAAQPLADRYYLASWGLAVDLAFERRLLGSRRLDDYVHALHRGADPVAAFEALVGEPLERFEGKHRRYLERLRPDGTAAASKR